MRTLGNILWHFPALGFLRAIGCFIGGALMCITIIFIPVGLGLFQIGKFQFLPFDRALVTRKDLAMVTGEPYQPNGLMAVLNIIARILYFIPGCVAVVAGVGTMIGEFCVLIGIPAGLTEARMLAAFFNPINKVCVPREIGTLIKNKKAQMNVSQYVGTAQQPQAPASEAEIAVREFDDEKLKDIIRNKQIYSAGIVAAAEKEMLKRVAGVEETITISVTETAADGTVVSETVSMRQHAAPAAACYGPQPGSDIGQRLGNVLGTYWQAWCFIGGMLLLGIGAFLPLYDGAGIAKIAMRGVGIVAMTIGYADLIGRAKGNGKIFVSLLFAAGLISLVLSTINIVIQKMYTDYSAIYQDGMYLYDYIDAYFSFSHRTFDILYYITVGTIPITLAGAVGLLLTSRNMFSWLGSGAIALYALVDLVLCALAFFRIGYLGEVWGIVFSAFFLIVGVAGWGALAIGVYEESKGKYVEKPLMSSI